MQVKFNSNNNYQNPNFKQVTLVQIPQKAFESQSMQSCERLFGQNLNDAIKASLKGFKGVLLRILRLQPKANCQLEHASYYLAKEGLAEQNLNYSMVWARQNTGLPIKDAVEDGYHSFYVLTKEHRKFAKKAVLFVLKNIRESIKEIVQKYTDYDIAGLNYYVKMGVELDKIYDFDGANAPSKVIKLDNLDELKNIINELGL